MNRFFLLNLLFLFISQNLNATIPSPYGLAVGALKKVVEKKVKKENRDNFINSLKKAAIGPKKINPKRI